MVPLCVGVSKLRNVGVSKLDPKHRVSKLRNVGVSKLFNLGVCKLRNVLVCKLCNVRVRKFQNCFTMRAIAIFNLIITLRNFKSFAKTVYTQPDWNLFVKRNKSHSYRTFNVYRML